MHGTFIRFATIGLALLASVVVTTPDFSTTAEASSTVSAQRSRQCSADARRNAGRGALIGGGAGLLASTSRWQVYYNYSYRNCVRR